MVFFNYALRKLNAKIVYYGPGLCGKTTNLQWIHDHFEGGQRGKMISLSTEGDRTIFFDLLPLEIGAIRGMDVTLQLYTVPGQVHYNSTRQLVLRGADGVVFVADSQSTMRTSNVESLRNLEENLSLQGVELASFPHVLQFNKRDLGDLISVEDLDSDLNQHSVPFFEAIATEGVGVQETLEGIVKLVMRSLRERYEPMAAAGITSPGIGPVPLDVEVPPPPPRPRPAPPALRPTVPPIESPRPPLAPPMPASRPRPGAESVGLEDDVPTRVYTGVGPPSDEKTGAGVTGGGFWSLTAEKGVADEASEEGTAKEGSADFGFTMPFADLETTTDVTKLDEPAASAPVETLAGTDRDEDDFEGAAVEVTSDIGTPFEVADLTPEPFSAASVFGGGEPAVRSEGEGEAAVAPHDQDEIEVEPAVTFREAEFASDVQDGIDADSAAAIDEADGASAEPAFDSGVTVDEPTDEHIAVERPASWPARLRGTVDDLVASVLGTRPGRGDGSPEPRPTEVEPEPEVELQLTPPEVPAPDAGSAFEPEPAVAERAWWETPLDEPAEADQVAFGDEPEEEPAVVEPAGLGEAVAQPVGAELAGADEMVADEPPALGDRGPTEGVAVEGVEELFGRPFEVDAAEPAEEISTEQPAGFDDAGGDESLEAEPEVGGFEREEVFVADEVVDVAPPPLGDRDWHEAHTGEVLAQDWMTDGEEQAAGETADESPEPAPFTAAEDADADRQPAVGRRMITLGDGDPFGDVVDDEPTPVRKEIQPQVVVAAPEIDRIVRPGDNQLHLRLHGTGAIAESGQVRALDIEVPVPGSWVGNRRVTLQLRLTLSPVPEDDDGGPGGAP